MTSALIKYKKNKRLNNLPCTDLYIVKIYRPFLR